MTILGHSLPEVKKAVIAFVFAVAALVGLFVHFNPGITVASVAVLVAAIHVVAVFNTPRHSYSDVSKALVALVTAAVALVSFFVVFSPGETAKVIAVVGTVLDIGGVFFVQNAGSSKT